jgi:hypothetical protein
MVSEEATDDLTELISLLAFDHVTAALHNQARNRGRSGRSPQTDKGVHKSWSPQTTRIGCCTEARKRVVRCKGDLSVVRPRRLRCRSFYPACISRRKERARSLTREQPPYRAILQARHPA